MASAPLSNRDIVVIGASTGGFQALQKLLAELPRDLPASVFVVVHVASWGPSRLPDLLTQQSPWPASYPLHGEAIKRGHVYVAPPDTQLTLHQGFVDVTRGPKENGHRPSVDALFRTAARAYGARVIGVVLTGQLDCGTAGLLSIKARGGLAIVQDPEEAEARQMPDSAVRHVEVDHVARLSELAQIIARRCREPAAVIEPMVSTTVRTMEGDVKGAPADFTCPICQGVITESEEHGFSWFRCHVGHAFSLESAVKEQAHETERALWAAIRALEESAGVARRMIDKSHGMMRKTYEEKQATLTGQAALLQRMVLGTLPAETLSESGE